jgi:hypothetical protein
VSGRIRHGIPAAALALCALALPPGLGAQGLVEPPPDREPLAAPVVVTLRTVPDPTEPGASEPTVGDPLWATVRAYGSSGTYLLPESVIAAYEARPEVAVLGSERRDGQLRLRLAVFRPGDVVLPTVDARVATAAGETLAVPIVSDTFRIASVLAPGDTLLADIKPLWPSPGIPTWVWVALVAAAALLAAGLWWWWRRRKRSIDADAEVEPGDPYAEARRRLEALAVDPPTPAGRIAAAGEIGDALRAYLARAWGTPALERTTLEILGSLPAPLAPERAALGSILSQVDLAKFARLAPPAGRVPVVAERAIGWLDQAEAARRPPVVADAGEAVS